MFPRLIAPTEQQMLELHRIASTSQVKQHQASNMQAFNTGAKPQKNAITRSSGGSGSRSRVMKTL